MLIKLGDSELVSLHPDWIKNLRDRKVITPDENGNEYLQLESHDDYAIIRPIKETDISVNQ